MVLRRRIATFSLPGRSFSMVLQANEPVASSFSGFSVFFYGYVIRFLGRRIGPSQDLLSQQDRNKQEITDIRPQLLWDLKNLCPSGRGSTGLKSPPPNIPTPNLHKNKSAFSNAQIFMRRRIGETP
jgi:hypothetical protein